MKKIILKAKINFKSELNLKNLSKINFEEKIISKINPTLPILFCV